MNIADKKSFILGMITAFCECVAAGCKDLALSPPLTTSDYEMVEKEAVSLIEKHGLHAYHEENKDLPEAERFEWIVITADPAVLKEYLSLREQGYSPSRSLQPFQHVLSYRPEKAVPVKYDAYRELFPMKEGAST